MLLCLELLKGSFLILRDENKKKITQRTNIYLTLQSVIFSKAIA